MGKEGRRVRIDDRHLNGINAAQAAIRHAAPPSPAVVVVIVAGTLPPA